MLFAWLVGLSVAALPSVDVVVTPEVYLKDLAAIPPGVLSPKGTYFAIDDGDEFAVRDRKSGKRLYKPEAGLCAFTPDESKFVGFSAEDALSVYDAATGKRLRTFKIPEGPRHLIGTFAKVAVRLTDDRVVLPGGLGPARVYDLVTGKLVAEICKDFRCDRLVVARGGRWIAASGSDRIVRIYDAKTAELARAIDTSGLGKQLGGVALSPDGKHLAVSYGGRGVTVYDCATGAQKESLTLRRAMLEDSMQFTDDGERIVFRAISHLPIPPGHSDPCLGWWDWKTGDRYVRLLLTGEAGKAGRFCHELGFLPDGMTGDGKTVISYRPKNVPMMRLDLSKVKPLPAAKEK